MEGSGLTEALVTPLLPRSGSTLPQGGPALQFLLSLLEARPGPSPSLIVALVHCSAVERQMSPGPGASPCLHLPPGGSHVLMRVGSDLCAPLLSLCHSASSSGAHRPWKARALLWTLCPSSVQPEALPTGTRLNRTVISLGLENTEKKKRKDRTGIQVTLANLLSPRQGEVELVLLWTSIRVRGTTWCRPGVGCQA